MKSVTVSRRSYLDVLRIFACFLVCYNHSFGFHLYLDPWDNYDLMFWIDLAVSAFTTVNIPLFLMISGALLLGREESYQTLFRKRIGRFALLLVGISLISYLFFQEERTAEGFLRALLGGQVQLSYWYLYAYLSLLIALPFVRRIAAGLCFQDICWLVALRFVLCTLYPAVNFYLGYIGRTGISLFDQLRIPMATFECFFYPLVGYYLANVLPVEKIRGKHILLCLAALIGGVLLTMGMVYAQGIFSGFTQEYIGLFNYSSAMAVFVILRWGMEKVRLPEKAAGVLAGISGTVVGIYLLEPFVTHVFYGAFFGRIPWTQSIITLASFAWSLLCMAIGAGTTWLLRRIPGVKKIL